MTGAGAALWGGIMLLGMAGAALCSGMETGVYCLNRIRLAVRAGRAHAGHPARLLQSEVERPERLISTLLIANSFFHFLIATGAASLLDRAGYDDGSIIAIDAAILTPIVFIFCESLPKEIFRVEADRLTYAAAPAISALRFAATVTLVLPLVRAVASVVSRWTGGEGEDGLSRSARGRLAAMLREGASQGALSEAQAGLVDRALLFHRATVADHMVPWDAVHAVGDDWDRPRVLRHMARHRHAWFPVVDRKGRAVGVLHYLQVHLRAEASLSDLTTSAPRVHPDQHAGEALDRIAAAGAGLAIVERDGRPVGIITPKDLVSPLIGDLPD